MLRFFKRKTIPTSLPSATLVLQPLRRVPQKGEKWQLYDKRSRDPWGPDVVVKILDVKEEWVRYYMNFVFNDERMPMGDFLNVYKPVDEIEESRS